MKIEFNTSKKARRGYELSKALFIDKLEYSALLKKSR